MAQGTRILSRLDDPWKLAAWEIDVVAPLIFCVFVGLIKGSPLSLGVGVAIGGFLSSRISKLKAAQHPGFARHFIYWHLPALGAFNNFKVLPASAYRQMVG
jgi:conjugal transfer pilus assembly protein TraL